MATVLLLGALLAGIVVLTPLADNWRIPLPILLTIFGLTMPFVPGVPSIAIEPELILPLVLPPLLFAATQKASAHEFKDNARPIVVLAVGLTVASAGATAVVAHWLGMEWGPAFVLGAIVAPPDPVAATAVARATVARKHPFQHGDHHRRGRLRRHRHVQSLVPPPSWRDACALSAQTSRIRRTNQRIYDQC